MKQEEVFSLLELDKVKRIISLFCQTPLGAAEVEAAVFRRDLAWVRKEQEIIREMRSALAGELELDLEGVTALGEILHKLRVVNRPLAAEELRRAEALLARLPKPQAEAIRLRVCDELRLEQIAGLLGCSVNTVASRLRYGFRKLRRLVPQQRREA